MGIKQIPSALGLASTPPRSTWDLNRRYVRTHPSAIIDPAASIKISTPPEPPDVCLEIGERSNLIKHKDWSHVTIRPITIGNRCWIGFNSLILKGIRLGDEAVVAAGSVVTRDVPPACVVAGNPARVVTRGNGST